MRLVEEILIKIMINYITIKLYLFKDITTYNIR